MVRIASQLLLVLAVLGLTGTTCGRGVSIESEAGPATTYELEVRNTSMFPVTVSYDDGTGRRLLGNVGANSQARFVISRPASATITILAADQSGSRTDRKRVVLRPGRPEVVLLSPR